MSDKKPRRTREAPVEVLRPAIVISGPSLRAKALKAQADVLPDMMAELMRILDEEAGQGKFQAMVPVDRLMPERILDQAEMALAITGELGKLGCHARPVEAKESKHGGAWQTTKICVEVSWREPTL